MPSAPGRSGTTRVGPGQSGPGDSRLAWNAERPYGLNWPGHKVTSEKRYLWDKFLRTLVPTKERRARTEKMPEHLAEQMCTDEGKKSWFQAWVASNCSWRELTQSSEEMPVADREGRTK